MEQALLNFDSQPLLSDDAVVLSLLRHGREAAVSSKEITRMTGLSERKIQQAVWELRLQGHLILAAVSPPYGYFLAANQEELVDYETSLMSRSLKEMKVVSLLKKVSLRMIFEQACLENNIE